MSDLLLDGVSVCLSDLHLSLSRAHVRQSPIFSPNNAVDTLEDTTVTPDSAARRAW